jgi:hypothetical protein
MPTVRRLDQIILDRLRASERHYPINVLPDLIRDTFAGAAKTLDKPGFYFRTAGAVAESHRMIEYALERQGEEEFIVGYNNQVALGYPWVLCGNMLTPTPAGGGVAVLDETAYVGIQMGSYGVPPPFPSVAGQAVLMLRQHIKSRGTFDFVVSDGNGGPSTIVSNPAIPWSAEGGHRVMIVSDPVVQAAYAMVDEIMLGPVTFRANYASFFSLSNPLTGMFLTSGVQTGPAILFAMFSSFMSGHYFTTGVGDIAP